MSSSPEVRLESATGPQNRFATLVLCAVVAAAPLPYGSTDASAAGVFVGLLGIGLLFAKPRFRGRREWLIFACMVLVGVCYALVLHEQLSPHPWLARDRDPVWDQMAHLLDGPAGAALSMVKDRPLIALGNTLACLGALACAFIVCASRRNAEQLLKVIAWSTLAYGVYGIAAYLVSPEMVLWREKVAYQTVLGATFPNRNTAAVYFGLGAMVWALLLLRQLLRQRVFRRGRWYLNNLRWSWRLGLNGAGFVVCFLAMMLTGSRAGAAASVVGILVAMPLLLRRELRSRRSTLWVGAPILISAVLAYLVVGGQLSERLGEHGLAGGGRFETYASTTHMILEHPLFGTGLGTFAFVFPRYRSGDISIWGIWDKAHNTLLELAAEVGIPLTVIVAAGWILALSFMLRGALRRQRGAIFPIAGLVGALIAALHSMVDFSLQVPGFAITVMSLIGLGLAQSEREAGQNGRAGELVTAERAAPSSGFVPAAQGPLRRPRKIKVNI